MFTFFSGTLDPFWPHVLLLSVAIVASFAVAIGIVMESPKWSIANALVVGGVALEAVCTLLLFAFDEGVSSAQQSKIIMLETAIAPRQLNAEEAVATGKFLCEKFPNIIFASTDWDQESQNFQQQFCAAMSAFCPASCGQIWLKTPQGSSSTLVVPGWSGKHKLLLFEHTKNFTMAPEISDATTDRSEWPEVEKRGIELLGPLGDLGFILSADPLVPEYATKPMLYISPKPPPLARRQWTVETLRAKASPLPAVMPTLTPADAK